MPEKSWTGFAIFVIEQSDDKSMDDRQRENKLTPFAVLTFFGGISEFEYK